MNNKLVIIAFIMALAVIDIIAILLLQQLYYVPTQDVNAPQQGYLTILGSSPTKIYLLNSTISYGTYERIGNELPWDEHGVFPGEPCVIVSGTIRNDGEEEWIPLGATLLNPYGKKVGTTVTYSSKPWFEAVRVEPNSTGTFEIRVKYDKHDISGYEVFLWWEPDAFPPP